MSHTKKVLERTLEIVSASNTWGKGRYIRHAGSKRLPAFPANKTKALSGEYQFCLIGAFHEANLELFGDQPNILASTRARILLRDCLPPGTQALSRYNDESNQEDVVALVKCAIEKAK